MHRGLIDILYSIDEHIDSMLIEEIGFHDKEVVDNEAMEYHCLLLRVRVRVNRSLYETKQMLTNHFFSLFSYRIYESTKNNFVYLIDHYNIVSVIIKKVLNIVYIFVENNLTEIYHLY